MTDTPFLTVADVARLVVMTEPYVRDKLSRQRGFPEPYRLGNSLRWKREDIERWIESRKLSPTARLSRPHVQSVRTRKLCFSERWTNSQYCNCRIATV